eukprot:TRINITY_DN8816_c0_g1_i1.p1 TRINITY_DN8816_c0_g1~~TRINITY_DN8816_c0_g1_i1.p1  ORF type:complete len:137 (-),score=50.15 TRINITY_DN8816_c0_g1_i1:105-515(-)
MASGVAVDPTLVSAFNNFKVGKTNKFLTFRLNDKKTAVELLKSGPAEISYKDFVASELPADDCRYAVFKFDFDSPDGFREKVIFISWVPDTAKIKDKMLYASTKDSVKKALVGLQIEIQGTDKGEVEYSVVMDKCK